MERHWWKNPRVIGGGALIAAMIISQGVEQWNEEYATPSLLADIAKLVIPALLVSGGLAELGRIVRGGGSDTKPSSDSDEERKGSA